MDAAPPKITSEAITQVGDGTAITHYAAWSSFGSPKMSGRNKDGDTPNRLDTSMHFEGGIFRRPCLIWLANPIVDPRQSASSLVGISIIMKRI